MARGRPATKSFSSHLALGLGLGLTACLLLAAWMDAAFLARFEHALLDLQFRLRGERPVGTDIVIVSVDEKSLQEVGRWPWSREVQAALVAGIAQDRPEVVALDLIYAEPQHDLRPAWSPSQVHAGRATRDHAVPLTAATPPRPRRVHPDRALARALERSGRVVLAMPLLVADARTRFPPELTRRTIGVALKKSELMIVKSAQEGAAFEPYHASAALPLVPTLAGAATGIGHAYSLPDIDGVTRREYVVLAYEDAYYPSFALEVARLRLDLPRSRVSLTLGEGIRLGSTFIPTDERTRMLIDYAGPARTFPYVSATDVLHGRLSSGTFTGKVVLVGTTALGTYDQSVTPFSANFPSVEKNATVIENILHGQLLSNTIWNDPLELGLVLLFGLTLTAGLPRLRSTPGALLGALLLLGYAALSLHLFAAQGLWIPLAAPALTIVLVFVTLTVVNVVAKEAQARAIRAMFSSYVSPRIVEELVRSPEKARLGGERRELTMLFADLVDFTRFTEKRPAEEVVAQLNEYLTAMTEVIFYWHGTLDKFVGDQIVVFWGAPLAQEDHAERAIKCALHMRKRLGELQTQWRAQGRVPLEHGIGINSGTVLVGNIGAEGKKMDYTIVGDQVNLAARFQNLTRHFGCPIVVTEHTARHVRALMEGEESADNRGRLGHVWLRRLGTVTVKGSTQALNAYAVSSLERNQPSRVDEVLAGEADGRPKE